MNLTSTINSISTLAAKTSRVILFHSANGKDSITLLNLMAPYFEQIVCVYMYMVPNLDHINRYIRHSEEKYPNCKFIQTPHYAYYNYKKHGFGGTEQVAYAEYNVSKITDKIRAETGLEWAIFGFKKNDSLNRRLMLNTYEDSMTSEKGQKLYPLADWKNSDVLAYIKKNRLIEPVKYGNIGNLASQGTDITNISFLQWCKDNYPEDLKKIYTEFPDSERLMFEHNFDDKNLA